MLNKHTTFIRRLMYTKFRLLSTGLKFITVKDYLEVQNDDPLPCLANSEKFPTPSQHLKIKKDSWYFIKIRVEDPSFSTYAKFSEKNNNLDTHTLNVDFSENCTENFPKFELRASFFLDELYRFSRYAV